ncbi:MAG TPA: sigma-70 family RNA polymerase sigma factor [Gemmataceae bacterium]|jgi:RNA polymerase sigma factor (sigma-70 family)
MAQGEWQTVVDHLRRVAGAAESDGLTDRQLLQRFAGQHDDSAFAVLVRRHAALVLGVCCRVLPRVQDAEDVFQATFLVLARKATSTSWRESIGNWLHEVAHRLAVKVRADLARRHIHERQAAAMKPTEARTDESWRELYGMLDEELHRLPQRYRQPLLLCYLEGRTRDQAARQLDWSLWTLHRRLERRLRLLRARLTRRGLTLSSALLAAGVSQQTATGGIPAVLLATTIRAAVDFTTSARGVPAHAAALAEEGLKTMSLRKAKVVLALMLVTSLAAGAGALTHQLPSATQPETRTPFPRETENNKPHAGPRVRTDALGDPLPPGAVARMGTLRLNHFGQLRCLIFSPDSKVLASAGVFGDIRLWDAATGKELRQIRAYKEQVSGLVFPRTASSCYRPVFLTPRSEYGRRPRARNSIECRAIRRASARSPFRATANASLRWDAIAQSVCGRRMVGRKSAD